MHEEADGKLYTVAGDSLLPFLEREWQPGAWLRIDPAPRSWAKIKPGLLRFLERRRERGLSVPRFHGFPNCAIGREWRELPVVHSPVPAPHTPCTSCSLLDRCSPPVEWSSELQPFGPTDPGTLWDRFHSRLCRVTGQKRRVELDSLVEHALAVFRGPLRNNPQTVEPSVVLHEHLLPHIRVVVFHGPVPEGSSAAAAASNLVLDGLGAMHESLGHAPPEDLMRCLASFPTCPKPTGLEAVGDALTLKLYVRMEHLAATDRKEALGELFGCVGAPKCEVPDLPERLHMIGVSLREGTPTGLKVYCVADPSQAIPEVGLPAIPMDHPLMTLSSRQAYAVVDCLGGRSPKWDFRLREQLLTGRNLGSVLRPILAPRAARDLDALCSTDSFRFDTVAAGLRDDRLALYLELS